MGDIAQRGNRLTFAKGGRVGLQSGGPHPENVKKWISPPGKRRKMGKPPKAGGPTHLNPKWRDTRAAGGRIGLKKGKMPWGTGPKPGTHDYLMQELHKPKKSKAAGGRAGYSLGKIAKSITKVTGPQGEFKKDKSWLEKMQKPPQLRKSKKERREAYRKKIQKGGGNVIFADEWKKIDPGLQKGLFKKDGGRAGHFAGSLVKNIPKLLKKLGKEVKAQPLPPQLQKTLDEVKKLQKPRAKKAAGGSPDPKHHKPKPPPKFPKLDHWKRYGRRNFRPEKTFVEQLGGSEKGKPHSTKEGRIASGTRRIKRLISADKKA